MSTDRSTFLHATCNERSHHLKTLMTSLLLKHVFQLLTHLICAQVFQILLKFWNHHSKHKTCHILGIINMFFPCPTGCTRISSRCFGNWSFKDIGLFLRPENNFQVAVPIHEVRIIKFSIFKDGLKREFGVIRIVCRHL
ncbi:hypothetical protein HanRHA438_Chr08g0334611 [Helianthus annuus]|nr:hypothetical protein HanRHA438_Chr08g0334611 [Helianthus annuus]